MSSRFPLESGLSHSEPNLPNIENAACANVLKIKNIFEGTKFKSKDSLKKVSDEKQKVPVISMSVEENNTQNVSKLKKYFEEVQKATQSVSSEICQDSKSSNSNTLPLCRKPSRNRRSRVGDIIAEFQTTSVSTCSSSEKLPEGTTIHEPDSSSKATVCDTVKYQNIFRCNCVSDQTTDYEEEDKDVHIYENVYFCKRAYKTRDYFNSKSEIGRKQPAENKTHNSERDKESEDEPIYDYPLITTRVGGQVLTVSTNEGHISNTDSDDGSGEYELVERKSERNSFVRELSQEIENIFSPVSATNIDQDESKMDKDALTNNVEISECNLNSGLDDRDKCTERSIQKAIKRHSRGGTIDDIQLYCTGITTLKNGQIILANADGELLVFDKKCQFMFLRDFPEQFQDITTVSESKVAATSGYTVKFYDIHPLFVEEIDKQTIDFFLSDVTLHGISFARNRLVVSCNLQSVGSRCKAFIRVMDTNGNVIQDIKRLRIQNRSLQYPFYVLADSTADRVFVSDSDLKSCLCLTYGGEVLWETRVNGIPKGLAAIGNNIALSIADKYHIAVFSKMGKPIDLVKIEDKEKGQPCLLSYNMTDNQLVMSAHSIDVLSFLRVIKIDSKGKKQSLHSPCKVS